MNAYLKVSTAVAVLSLCAMAGAQKLSKVSLSVPSVAGGATSAGTVELTAKAGPAGVVVTMTSSNPIVTIPPSITIPSGQTTVNFTAATTPVALSATVTIKATLGTSSSSTTLVVEAPKLAELSFIPTSVVGGAGATATLKLDSAAPANGLTVSLSASSPAWGGPSSVMIPAGATSATFAFTTTPVGEITHADVTATMLGSKAAATLTVESPHIATFVLSSTSVVGGVSPTGTITLNGPAPKGGFKVSLTAEGSAKVKPSVEVAAGATTATVPVSTLAVATKSMTRINASAPGASVELLLTVNPPSLTAFNLSTPNVSAGQSTMATVTLNGIAPAGGFKIALQSNQAAVKVPAFVTVPAGATTASFSITSAAGSQGTSAGLTATPPAGAALTATLSVVTTSTTKAPPPHKA